MARSKPKQSLPRDIFIEAFCLLPVMSLLKCKSVCKSWLSIIEDPEFIKLHMAKVKPSLLMIFNDDFHNKPPQFPCIDFKYYLHVPVHFKVGYETNKSLPGIASIESQYYLDLGFTFRVVGSCNGIICLVAYKRCYFWNPSIMQSRELPGYPGFSRKGLEYDHYRVKVAFGFDSISDEYKVLRFISPQTIHKTTNVPIVELYSTGTDSWKVIKFPDKSPREVVKLNLGPVINGVLHMKYKGQLVSFDLHNEVFSVITSFPRSKLIKSELLDFESSVAVIFQSRKEKSPISPWTLANVCGQLFWTKRFNIVNRDIDCVYSYLGDGLLYVMTDKKKLYDYTNNEFKSFPSLSKAPKAVFKFTETLASIEGFKRSALFRSKFYPQV